MGRWLAELKKRELTADAYLQNPQNPTGKGFEGFEGAQSGACENFSTPPLVRPGGFEGFEGSPLGAYANFSDPRPTQAEGVLRVLTVPVLGESENFSADHRSRTAAPVAEEEPASRTWDELDWRAEFEERAGILEFDGGFTRDEAERLAAAHVRKMRLQDSA